ncbi:hypothetical protein [Streptomyces sp. NPDC018031]|uniref:hypothetical protein n=1 Tax=Streptomyces sp. NPDC018031 TaxID=3365033 RepID=UPI0037B9AB5E
MTLREGRLDMVSAAHTHTAHLSAEVWDGEPPVEDGERWEAREEGEIFSPTGRLAVCVTTTKQLDRIALGRPGVRWKARLYCTGRDEARQQEKVEFPDGVERYLVQFWPFL